LFHLPGVKIAFLRDRPAYDRNRRPSEVQRKGYCDCEAWRLHLRSFLGWNRKDQSYVFCRTSRLAIYENSFLASHDCPYLNMLPVRPAISDDALGLEEFDNAPVGIFPAIA
jgi:hypothetical protein